MLILCLLLSVPLIKVDHSLDLSLTLLLWQDKLIDEPVFTDHDALLINDIVKFSIVFLEDVVLVVFFVFVIL